MDDNLNMRQAQKNFETEPENDRDNNLIPEINIESRVEELYNETTTSLQLAEEINSEFKYLSLKEKAKYLAMFYTDKGLAESIFFLLKLNKELTKKLKPRKNGKHINNK